MPAERCSRGNRTIPSGKKGRIGHYLGRGEVPPLSLWATFHAWKWPQAFRVSTVKSPKESTTYEIKFGHADLPLYGPLYPWDWECRCWLLESCQRVTVKCLFGEWRASRVELDISGRQRHLSSSKGSQKLSEGKSSSRLSVSFCRANSLLAKPLAKPL